MNDSLSIVDTKKEISLDASKEDRLALAIKSISGIIPFGGVLGDVLANAIPNQKMERVVDFIHILNYKIETAERRIEDSELKSQEFMDLLEEGVIQASKAPTKERLNHIASILKNSITDNELDSLGKEKLLNLLGELNDAEIIWLKNYSFKLQHVSMPDYKKYFEKHQAVLEPVSPNLQYRDLPRDVINKKALAEGYRNNLARLGLIKEEFDRVNKQGPDPDFDHKTGTLKSKGTICTDLGQVLLDYLDLNAKEGASELK